MGYLANVLSIAETSLANCWGFQQWAGAANATAAAARIYREGLPRPVETYDAAQLAALRPYAIIYPAETGGLRVRRDSAALGMTANGILEIVLSKSVPAISANDADLDAILATLAGQVDDIIYTGNPAQPGLFDLSVIAGRLNCDDIEANYIGRTPREYRNEYGDAYDVLLRVRWGGSQT